MGETWISCLLYAPWLGIEPVTFGFMRRCHPLWPGNTIIFNITKLTISFPKWLSNLPLLCTFTASNLVQISIATFLGFYNTLVTPLPVLIPPPDSFPFSNIQQVSLVPDFHWLTSILGTILSKLNSPYSETPPPPLCPSPFKSIFNVYIKF